MRKKGGNKIEKTFAKIFEFLIIFLQIFTNFVNVLQNFTNELSFSKIYSFSLCHFHCAFHKCHLANWIFDYINFMWRVTQGITSCKNCV